MYERVMVKIYVEQYVRTGRIERKDMKVTRVPDQKSTFVEPNVDGIDGGRSVVLSEYKVDGKTYWAGYSERSQTIYVSFW